ncbi:peptide ABC transporter substrate-binding protein [Streptomyces sp. NPDC049577]|uniref:peptide ABC transporter substrate-binding protein n=1 Tax=Streptomyces sp. NPDC049577 TaxID=3155153 RepID=UPI00342AD29B
MRGAKSAKWVTGAIVVALAATACGGGGKKNDDAAPAGKREPFNNPATAPASNPKQGGTFSLGITEPKFIDPYNSQESEGEVVTQALFTGLYKPTADGKLVPMLATSGTSDDKCTVWDFGVKTGTKFTNGEDVDAESFVRGWTRAALKESASDVAYHMAGIKGFDDIQGGKTDKFEGVTAPAPDKLHVELSKPDCGFNIKTGHSVFSPVPKAAGAANNKDYNEAPIGNGPFKMEGKWEHNKSITLVRNDDYGLQKAHLDKVNISILNPQNSVQLETQGFQAGQFDWARMPVPQMPTLKAKYAKDNEWLEQETAGMNFVLPITDNGPLKTKEARLAVSYAIDRNAIANGVFKGLQSASTTILPPSFKGVYQDGLCGSCVKQDKDKAKELAEKAGLGKGTSIDLQYNTGAGHEEWMQAVAKQIEDVLGWKVNLKGQAFAQLLDAEQSPKGSGMFRFAWSADYPTPDAILFPLLATQSINKDANGKVVGDNRSRWSNKEFDTLLDKARETKDEAARNKLYQQAEKIALDDAALIPVYTRTQQRLVNTKKFAGVSMDYVENPTLADISLR